MTAFENIGLDKAETGVYGLDDLTFGGLARGRTTLLCGGPGTGKTVLAAQFLVNGATEFGEPGVFMRVRGGQGETSPRTWPASAGICRPWRRRGS